MMNFSGKIEKTLKERVDNAKQELRDDFKSCLQENSDIANFDDYLNHQSYDTINDITGNNTPTNINEINGIYYLYGNELEQAYDNVKYGDVRDEAICDIHTKNFRQVCISMHIKQELYEEFEKIGNEFDFKMLYPECELLKY